MQQIENEYFRLKSVKLSKAELSILAFLQAEGRRFEPVNPHNPKTGLESDRFYFWWTFQACPDKDIKNKNRRVNPLL